MRHFPWQFNDISILMRGIECPQEVCFHKDRASCWVLIISKNNNNWSCAFWLEGLAVCVWKWIKCCVFIRLFKMSASRWNLIKRGGCSVMLVCPALLCKCTSHDMPENLHYYNNANKNGKLWILYRRIKKCNFSVTWITLRIAALALWKKAALRSCFVSLWTSSYLTILRTEIIEETLTQGYTLKGRWDSLPPPPPALPPFPFYWTRLSSLAS